MKRNMKMLNEEWTKEEGIRLTQQRKMRDEKRAWKKKRK